MSASDPRVAEFLSHLMTQGRSSPDGMSWHRFHQFLARKKSAGRDDPPAPLILAASGESNGSKHRRLASQLEWALENKCLDEALQFLREVPADQWNSGWLERWEEDGYPR